MEECKAAITYLIHRGIHVSREQLSKEAKIPETVARRITELDIEVFTNMLKFISTEDIKKYLLIRTADRCSDKVLNNFNYLIKLAHNEEK